MRPDRTRGEQGGRSPSLLRSGSGVMGADLTQAETLARMQQALDRMPPLRRAVFLAIRQEQLTFAQVGERHAITAEQLEHELTEALVALVEAADNIATKAGPTWCRLLLRVVRRRAWR